MAGMRIRASVCGRSEPRQTLRAATGLHAVVDDFQVVDVHPATNPAS